MLSQLGRSLLLAGILLVPRAAGAQAEPDSMRARLLRQAQAHNPELSALRAAVRADSARIDAARAREAPVLSVEADEIPDGELWNAGNLQLGVDQVLLSGGRRNAAAGVAAIELRRREIALSMAEQTVDARIDRELAQWRGYRVIDQRLKLEDDLLKDVEEGLASRFATGQARYVDVLRVRTERLRVQSERADASAQATQAGLRLQLLTGVDSLANEPSVSINDSLPVPVAIDSLFDVLDRSGLFSMGQDLAEAERRRLVAERTARVGVGLGIQRFGERGNFKVGPALRAQASLPFAVGRSNATVRAAADLAVAQGAAQASADRAIVRSRLRQAADRYAAARNRTQLFDAALLRGSRTEREAALAAYRTGELTLIELLDFERALARAETDQVRAVIEARNAFADLFDLMRGHDD